MAQFKLTNLAKQYLIKIAKYSEIQWGREQRNDYLKQFDNTFHLLALKPQLGMECNYVKKNYRKFPQASHIIFYKEGAQADIEIIRILHKSMDVTSKFK